MLRCSLYYKNIRQIACRTKYKQLFFTTSGSMILTFRKASASHKNALHWNKNAHAITFRPANPCFPDKPITHLSIHNPLIKTLHIPTLCILSAEKQQSARSKSNNILLHLNIYALEQRNTTSWRKEVSIMFYSVKKNRLIVFFYRKTL